jgi:hypothetical protein
MSRAPRANRIKRKWKHQKRISLEKEMPRRKRPQYTSIKLRQTTALASM